MMCPNPKTCPWYDGRKAGVPFCVLPVCVRQRPGKGKKKLPKASRSSEEGKR